jgi:hypothetical protein
MPVNGTINRYNAGLSVQVFIYGEQCA